MTTKRLPLGSLEWEDFQDFCLILLDFLYIKENPNVHLNGKKGNKQNGYDLEIIFSDGTVHQYECKREAKFSDSQLHNIFEANKNNVNKKILLMSGEANSKNRKKVKAYSPWDIWDQVDISSKFYNNLSLFQKKILCDSFFPGQRISLLGETETGPWLSHTEFFQSTMNKDMPLNHTWEIVGREAQITESVQAVCLPQKKLMLITGLYDSGKSRFLKALMDECQNKADQYMFAYFDQSEALTNKYFEFLGKGKKIIVIDDAQNMSVEDMRKLEKYILSHPTQTKIILVSNIAGTELIKQEFGFLFFDQINFSEITLERLNLKSTLELTNQALQYYDGNKEYAEKLSEVTEGHPFLTILHSQLISDPSFDQKSIINKESYSNLIKNRYQKIFTGEIDKSLDVQKVKLTRDIIALTEPFNEKDDKLVSLIKEQTNLTDNELKMTVKILLKNGLLLKQRTGYKISPPILADIILQDIYKGEHESMPTKRIINFIEALDTLYFQHICLNLARVEWQLTVTLEENVLLQSIWGKLKKEKNFSVIKSIAYYQPEKAIQFVEHALQLKETHASFPEILQLASYNLNCLGQGCRQLWKIICNDEENAEHAYKVLLDLGEVRFNKDKQYSEKVVDFALYLLKEKNALRSKYNPLTILKFILYTSGEHTAFKGNTVVITTFNIPYDYVINLRMKVIDATIDLLVNDEVFISIASARFIKNSLTYSYRTSAEERKKWMQHFLDILKKLLLVIRDKQLHFLTAFFIAESLNWHIFHGNEDTNSVSNQIFKLLEDSLEFKVASTLMHGNYFNNKNYLDITLQLQDQNLSLECLTDQLQSNYPSENLLFEFLLKIEDEIFHYCPDITTYSYNIYNSIIQKNYSFALCIIDKAKNNLAYQAIKYLGLSISRLLSHDYNQGTAIVHELFQVEGLQSHAILGLREYIRKSPNCIDDYETILRQSLISENEDSIMYGLQIITDLTKIKPMSFLINLVKLANIGLTQKTANTALNLFQNMHISFSSLEESDVEKILSKLVELPDLDDYWIKNFLTNASKDFSGITATFFMNRADFSVSDLHSFYMSCPLASACETPLFILDSSQTENIKEKFHAWWRQSPHKKNNQFCYNASHVFKLIFGSFDDDMVEYFLTWLDNSDEDDLFFIGIILSEADNHFVFKHSDFVVKYLEFNDRLSDQAYFKQAFSNLFASAALGIKGGVAGEPYPRDKELMLLSSEILEKIPEHSVARPFYEKLKKTAEENIKNYSNIYPVKDCS